MSAAPPAETPDPRFAPILLAGPTAVGKSEVATLLAGRLGGEIVSVDSMQVYRGMDIGTAKPSSTERARVPHHLIDVVSAAETFDAARYVGLAREAICGIQQRGRVPILCGGTGLYFKALSEGVGKAPPVDPELRTQLAATPLSELVAELREQDPAACERIDLKNPRRVIRAVAVIRQTGRPFSEQRSNWKRSTAEEAGTTRQFGLMRSGEDLRGRIDSRVEAMFRLGLVEETRHLLSLGLAENLTAMQALGYRQVVEHLRGIRGLSETIELVKSRTRKYAKRQGTWFRGQMSLHWLTVAPDESAESVVERLAIALG